MYHLASSDQFQINDKLGFEPLHAQYPALAMITYLLDGLNPVIPDYLMKESVHFLIYKIFFFSYKLLIYPSVLLFEHEHFEYQSKAIHFEDEHRHVYQQV